MLPTLEHGFKEHWSSIKQAKLLHVVIEPILEARQQLHKCDSVELVEWCEQLGPPAAKRLKETVPAVNRGASTGMRLAQDLVDVNVDDGRPPRPSPSVRVSNLMRSLLDARCC
jgi:hypothetical protein